MCCLCTLPIVHHLCGAIDTVGRLVQLLMVVLVGGYVVKLAEYAAEHGGHTHALEALGTGKFWLVDGGHLLRGAAVAAAFIILCAAIRAARRSGTQQMLYVEHANTNI